MTVRRPAGGRPGSFRSGGVMKKIRISIIGANGYTGMELLRLLANHPGVEVRHAVSRSLAGRPIPEYFPSLHAYDGRVFESADSLEALCEDSDAAFLCLPHAASAEMAGRLFRLGVKVIDLSADFRYRDVRTYEQTYRVVHPEKELLQAAVYGLPELFREQIRTAGLVGNPGCYTTCSILTLFPLIKEGVVSPEHLIIDAKSGVSGAGKKTELSNLFAEVHENFKAYAVTTHRHTSEIEEKLSLALGRPLQVSFTPHLLPVQRGILATIYADLLPGGATRVADVYRAFYKDEPFVRVFDEGVLPELKQVRHSNYLHIGFQTDPRLNRVVLIGCLDNLVKGASGQAIQNLNLMFGLDERTGLMAEGDYL